MLNHSLRKSFESFFVSETEVDADFTVLKQRQVVFISINRKYMNDYDVKRYKCYLKINQFLCVLHSL